MSQWIPNPSHKSGRKELLSFFNIIFGGIRKLSPIGFFIVFSD